MLGPGFEPRQERREKFLLQGQLSVLTLISVSVPPLCYHRSRSFCQKCSCRLQVNAHTPYLCGLNEVIQSSGAWLNGVHRTCATWADIVNTRCKRIQSLIQNLFPSPIGHMVSVDVKHYVYLHTVQNHKRPERSESAREQRIVLYKSDQL